MLLLLMAPLLIMLLAALAPTAQARKYVEENWDSSAPAVGNWQTNANLDFKGWQSFVSDPGSLSTSQAPTDWAGRGLYALSGSSAPSQDGTAEWRWKAPGTSTIYQADYAPSTSKLLGCMNEGLRDADGSWQPTVNGHPNDAPNESYHPTACGVGVLEPPQANAQVILGDPGQQRFCSNLTNPCDLSGSPVGNSAVFGIQRLGLSQPSFAAYLPGARLRLTDYDRPQLAAATNSLSGRWVKDGTGQIATTATDTGLGVKSVRVDALDLTGGSDVHTRTHSCSGDRNDRCPATWNSERPSYAPSFSYNVDSLPEGVDHFGVKVTDIVENDSLPADDYDLTTVPPTKVDRTPATAEPSGELFDLRDQSINGVGLRSVTAGAVDPNSEDDQSLSGTRYLAVEDIGHGIIAQSDVCAEDLPRGRCPTYAASSFNIDTGQLAEGAHQFRIVSTDLAGNVGTSAPWTVLVDR